MALLPDPNQIKRGTPRPSSTVTSYRGDTVGRAQEQFGVNVAQFGTEVAKMAALEGNRIDESMVDQAYTELRQKRAELSLGERGYSAVKGAMVVSTPEGGTPFTEDYKQRFDAAAEGIAKRLSPRQREKFGAQASKESVSFQTDIMQHAMKESEAFHADAKQGKINTEMQLGVSNWADPAKAAESLGRINETYDNMILVDGLAADKVNSIRAAQVSKFHEGVMEQALAAGDTEYAKRHFEANKKEILGAEVVGAKVTEKGNDKEDFAIGNDVADKHIEAYGGRGNVEAGYKAIRENSAFGGDPARIKNAQAAFMDRVHASRDALNQQKAAGTKQVMRMSEVDYRNSPQFVADSPAKQRETIAFIRKDNETPTLEQLLVVDKLVHGNPEKLAQLSEDEVYIMGQANRLSRTQIKTLLDTRAKYADPQKVHEAKVDNNDLSAAFIVANRSVPKAGDKDFILAKDFARRAVEAKQKQLGRALEGDEKRKIYARAMVDVTPGFWSSETPAFKATPEQRREALTGMKVDPARHAEVSAGLGRALGRPPTDLEVRQYVWENDGP